MKFPARMKQLSQALAIPEDARPGLLEILKFGNPGADFGNRLDHADGGVKQERASEGRTGEYGPPPSPQTLLPIPL